MEENSNSNKKIIVPVIFFWAIFIANLNLTLFLKLFDGYYIFFLIYLFVLAIAVSLCLDIPHSALHDFVVILSYIYYLLLFFEILNIINSDEDRSTNLCILLISINICTPLPSFYLKKRIKRILPKSQSYKNNKKKLLNMKYEDLKLSSEANN